MSLYTTPLLNMLLPMFSASLYWTFSLSKWYLLDIIFNFHELQNGCFLSLFMFLNFNFPFSAKIWDALQLEIKQMHFMGYRNWYNSKISVWHRERFTALIFRWPKLQLTTGSANHQPLLETLIKQYNLSLVSMTPSVPITTSALCKISSVKSSFFNDLSLFCLHINLLYYYFDNKSSSWPKWS